MVPAVLEQQQLLRGCFDKDAKMLAEFEDRSYLRTIRRIVRETLETKLDKEEVERASDVVVKAVYEGWNRLPREGTDLRQRIRSYAQAVAERFYDDWVLTRLQGKP
jgi:hypothetical protein